jgi:hypothetical protein
MAHFKRLISASIVQLVFGIFALGQCQMVDPPPPPQQLGGGGNYASWNGWYLPTSGTLRILVVLIEQDGAAGSTEWPAHQLPIWINNPKTPASLPGQPKCELYLKKPGRLVAPCLQSRS